MPRDNFSASIKNILAKRAGYQCSMCKCLTVGPSQEGDSAVNLTGEAAHIASAAEGGRRYDHDQTPEERSGIQNAIWLCSKHADYIDGDESTYTVVELHRIKDNHEQRIKLQQAGLQVERGGIIEIELTNFGEITNNVALKFTDRNLILGSNGVGKTLICELISALSDKDYLDRWEKHDWDKSNSYCSIGYYKNELSKFTIAIDSSGIVSYTYNGYETPIILAPFHVFYLEESIYDFRHRINREREEKNEDLMDEHDLLSWLAQYFKLTQQEFVNVINTMKREKKFFVNDISVNHAQKTLDIRYGSRRSEGYHSFGSYSTGEQERILLEIVLKLATYYARFQTTILLLENTSIGVIDETGLNKLLDIVRQENLGFQFFFTSFQKPDYFDASGYTVYHLIKEGKGKIITPQLIKAT